MFKGSLVALVTPFDGNNRVDYASLKRLIDFHVDAGSNGLVIAGTTGESATLTRSEHIELIGGDALAAIEQLDRGFDLVFIDPPYAQAQLRAEVFESLEGRGLLRDRAVVYFEWPRVEDFELPSTRLEWLKLKGAGQIYYAIAEWRVSR